VDDPQPIDSFDIEALSQAEAKHGSLALGASNGIDSIYPASRFKQKVSARDSFVKLTGYYLFEGNLQDSIYLESKVTSDGKAFTTGAQKVYATTSFQFDTVDQYTKFTITYNYQQRPDQDSIYLEMAYHSRVGDPSVADSSSTLRLRLDSFAVNTTTATGGIENQEQPSQLSIRPNPASQSIKVRTSSSLTGSTIELYNSTGKRVQTYQQLRGRELQISVEELPSGLYFLKLNKANTVTTRKVFIR
jgi:hypothetical protein